MELIPPQNIALDNASLGIVSDVEDTARRVIEDRPLPAEVVQEILQGLFPERVHCSNAIEGNTLDYRETVEVLKGAHVDVAKKRDAQEAINLGEAIKMVQEGVKEGAGYHSPERLLSLHAVVLRDIDDTWGGRYREQRVMISGATHQPPDARLVPSLVERVMGAIARPADDVSPLVRAVWAHWALARIHPFLDGNGRTARLWQDLILFQGHLTCAIIRPSDRRDYLDALGDADEGDFNPLVQLVAMKVLTSLDEYEAAMRREPESSEWAADLVNEVGLGTEDDRRLEYMRWSHKMSRLLAEFVRCASEISEALPDVRVEVRPHDIIDQQCWENIRSGTITPRTWYFRVLFHKRDEFCCYFFFFGRHASGESDTEDDRSSPRVGLFVSENFDPSRGAGASDVAISGEIDDRDNDAREIAQDFMKEVILSKLG
jgi:cell filamentation protein, protein adenylyltransferase